MGSACAFRSYGIGTHTYEKRVMLNKKQKQKKKRNYTGSEKGKYRGKQNHILEASLVPTHNFQTIHNTSAEKKMNLKIIPTVNSKK